MIPDEGQIPGAPDWERRMQGAISTGNDIESISLSGLSQTDQQEWRDTVQALQTAIDAEAKKMINSCCDCRSGVVVTWVVVDTIWHRGLGLPFNPFSFRFDGELGIEATYQYVVYQSGPASSPIVNR